MEKLPSFSPVIRDVDKKHATVKIGMDKRTASQIMERMSVYKALPEKFRPGLEEIADYVRNDMIADTFRREGPGWKPLAKRTVRERQQAGYSGRHPILQRSKDLYRELTDKSHPHHIEVIKVGQRARIEIGGSSAKFLENQMGKKSQRLPSRPMIPGTGGLPLRDRDKMEMTRILQRSFNRYITRPR